MLIIDQNSKIIDFHEFSRDLLNISHEHCSFEILNETKNAT